MISTHCPLHYNGYQQQQAGQPPTPQNAIPVNAQQQQPPHLYAQHPQMRLQPQLPVNGSDMQPQQPPHTRINQQNQQQQQQPPQQQQQPHATTGEPQVRMMHVYGGGQPGKGLSSSHKGMANGQAAMPWNNGTATIVTGAAAPPMAGYPPRHQPPPQYRKYPPQMTRPDGKPKPLSPSSINSCQSGNHIPTVSANGIPGAAETTVTNIRTTASSSSLGSSSGDLDKGILKSSEGSIMGKEKTAMCLVNELSRFNKLTQQYRLTNEQGPAHQRRFTVTLTLGTEEYTAEGGSIKKAQHAAASEAITKTKYTHPPMKVQPMRSESVNLTPTVELNALAMKRREKAVYIYEEQPMPAGAALHMPPPPMHLPKQGYVESMGHHYANGPPPPLTYRGLTNGPNIGGGPPMMNPRRYPGPGGLRDLAGQPMGGMGRGGRPLLKGAGRLMKGVPPMMVGLPHEPLQVKLEVGGRQFIGIGFTPQAARHNAAAKALAVLKKMPEGEDQDGSVKSGDGATSGGPPDSKSPVSMIHEIALKRNMTVTFSLKNETGPSHMKVFFTICTVGEITIEGEGNSKKASKKNAAEKMYQELLKLPPINPSPQPANALNKNARPKKKSQETVKKKPKQIIKPEAEPAEELNPISRLMQIQQAKKDMEPVYLLLEQRGTPRRREFVMQVRVDGLMMQGTGPNKKLAKRRAAENLLQAMGYEVTPGSGEVKPAAASSPESSAKGSSPVRSITKKVQFTESSEGPAITDSTPVVSANGDTGSRQLVPGIALPDGKKKAKAVKKDKSGEKNTEAETKGSEVEDASKSESSTDGARPKDQLIYLSKIIGFKVQFSDFPKGNHGEFLTLITLNTDPPQFCHGSGKTLEASHDQAALTTLNLLSELGLDNVRPKKASAGPTEGDSTSASKGE